MSTSVKKQERLDVLNRYNRRIRSLEEHADDVKREIEAIHSDISSGMFDKARHMEMIQRLQFKIVEHTQTENEIKEVQRFLTRASETFTRDYPQFGRGTFR